VLLADGATGTNFQNMGIQPGVAPEEWVFDAPDRVAELHRRFADAGSDLCLTCTFGASPPRLEDGPLAGRAAELNERAVQIAREAVGPDRLIAGSLGPTGQLTEPLGPLSHEDCASAYAEQTAALVAGGVDLLVIATFFSMDEALWAIEGIRRVSELPLIASFSFDQGTRTMMGLSAADVVAGMAGLGLAAVGANCGRSLEDNAVVVSEFFAAGLDVPLWIKPNAGVPRVEGDAVVYEAGPEDLAARVGEFVDQGASIVGGCCGSTPEHIAAIRRVLDERSAR
jgi:5-methyltetrahydrofolate--homocysteine methyltransferase